MDLMKNVFAKDYLPDWCPNCNKQGIYFVDDTHKPYWVVHPKCGHEIISAWCPKCEIGYALPNKSGEQPSEWTCDDCMSVYPLPHSVYSKAVDLYIEDEMPLDVRKRVLPKRRGSSFFWNLIAILSVAFAVGVGIVCRNINQIIEVDPQETARKQAERMSILSADFPDCLTSQTAPDAVNEEYYCIIGFVHSTKIHDSGRLTIWMESINTPRVNLHIIEGEPFQWISRGDCIIARGLVLIFEDQQQMLPVDSIEACPN